MKKLNKIGLRRSVKIWNKKQEICEDLEIWGGDLAFKKGDLEMTSTEKLIFINWLQKNPDLPFFYLGRSGRSGVEQKNQGLQRFFQIALRTPIPKGIKRPRKMALLYSFEDRDCRA